MLATKLGRLCLPNLLYNASGCMCTTETDLSRVLNSSAGAAITKSCTWEPRNGNEMPRLSMYNNGSASINSTGLANLGISYYTDVIKQHAHTDSPKPLLMSVARTSTDDFMACLNWLATNEHVELPEFNASCPNLGTESLSTDALADTIERIESTYGRAYGLKLSPVFTPAHADSVAATLLNHAKRLAYVTCCNSIPNGLYVDVKTVKPVIVPHGGHGGIGGAPILPVALANVRWMYTRLHAHDIAIVGCGGISTGAHAFSHILCGASALQVGTELLRDGPRVFARVQSELAELMRQHGYVSVYEACGALETN